MKIKGRETLRSLRSIDATCVQLCFAVTRKTNNLRDVKDIYHNQINSRCTAPCVRYLHYLYQQRKTRETRECIKKARNTPGIFLGKHTDDGVR